MRYLFSTLLFLLYLVNSEFHLSPIIMLALGLILILMIYVQCRKTNDSITSLIIILCFTWPFAWNNIFGSPAKTLQITWFYLIEAIICITILIKTIIFKTIKIKKNALVLVFFILITIFIPLLLSKSINEGIKEFLPIAVFIIVILCGMFYSKGITDRNKMQIFEALIWTDTLVSIGIIIQYVAYSLKGLMLFQMSLSYWYGGIQKVCVLLMQDASSAGVMIGCGAFSALILVKEKKHYYFNIFIILIGLSLTGRRTGAICLIIMMGIYMLIVKKGVINKAKIASLFICVCAMVFYFMNLSRPVENFMQNFDSNGRTQLWSQGISLFNKNPIMGYGYDNVHLVNLMKSKMIVHNTYLRWLDMGGIIFTVPLIIFIIMIFYYSYRLKNKLEFWLIAYILLAANLIPDIINSRFFTVICVVTVLSYNYHNNIRCKDNILGNEGNNENRNYYNS